MISDFHRDVDEIFVLQGCYAEYSGNSLSAFQSKLSGPSSRAMKSKPFFLNILTLEDGDLHVVPKRR